MKPTDDLRVKGYLQLPQPEKLKWELPITRASHETVTAGRRQIEHILQKKDRRLLVIVGPCSIHDETAALEYATRLNQLRQEVQDAFCVVMRVYFEKPRTSVGWKGLINDPGLDGSCDITKGLQKARRLLLQITAMGVPTATEFLETITPQFLADLVSWSAIGARTTESQTHREMASGLSMPVGFKNGTDGNLSSAINAVAAAAAAQSFLGIDQNGRTCVVKTAGNPWGHVVLRGGKNPNYDPISIEEARLKLIGNNLPETIMVDCSHGNSRKKHQGQAIVWKSVIDQYIAGNEALTGLMLESNLQAGSQKFRPDLSALKYGLSITDECISWESTEQLLLCGRDKLMRSFQFDRDQRWVNAV
ncbi:MAG: 3-deoxy-7-phosphoheptulonate synthase [Desulfobacteraceae bacterium 4572_123]|nr:MAG: 3-deoxy-7-phosphoheptulonate synthase [Desulfobacteraceae bacterium 4572_123]